MTPHGYNRCAHSALVVPPPCQNRRSVCRSGRIRAACLSVILATASLAIPSPVDAQDVPAPVGAWRAAAPLDMCTPPHESCHRRTFSKGVLLATTGEVLVVGNNSGDPKGQQIYDIVSETWRPIPGAPPSFSGSSPRDAIELTDGRVLIEQQIYDPHEETWTEASLAPDITWKRTLLQDGTVLMHGGSGVNVFEAHNVAYRYDPIDNVKRETGPMTTVRGAHTSTRMEDGRVLVAGGVAHPNNVSTPSAEIYNPDTQVWTPTASMVGSRTSHAAVALRDGGIFVLGGSTCVTDPLNPTGNSLCTPTDPPAEIFTPSSGPGTGGTWTATAPTPITFPTNNKLDRHPPLSHHTGRRESVSHRAGSGIRRVGRCRLRPRGRQVGAYPTHDAGSVQGPQRDLTHRWTRRMWSGVRGGVGRWRKKQEFREPGAR